MAAATPGERVAEAAAPASPLTIAASARVGRVADQPMSTPAIRTPVMAKPAMGQAAPSRPKTQPSKSDVSSAPPRAGGVQPRATGNVTHAPVLSPTAAAEKIRGGIPIAGALLPLSLAIFALALLRLRRKRKSRPQEGR